MPALWMLSMTTSTCPHTQALVAWHDAEWSSDSARKEPCKAEEPRPVLGCVGCPGGDAPQEVPSEANPAAAAVARAQRSQAAAAAAAAAQFPSPRPWLHAHMRTAPAALDHLSGLHS